MGGPVSRALVLVFAAVLTACGGAGGGDSDAEAPDGSGGSVTADLQVLETDVEAHRPEEAFVAAADGDTLTVGDAVRTRATGFAQIDYPDGSLTRLDVDTTFELVALSATEVPDVTVRLNVGRSWHRVEQVAGRTYAVETNVGIATVRGTAFDVWCTTAPRCTFAVVEGQVEVVPSGDEAGVVIDAGQRVVVGPDGVEERDDPGVGALGEDPWIARNVLLDDEGDGSGGSTAPTPTGNDGGTETAQRLAVGDTATFEGWSVTVTNARQVEWLCKPTPFAEPGIAPCDEGGYYRVSAVLGDGTPTRWIIADVEVCVDGGAPLTDIVLHPESSPILPAVDPDIPERTWYDPETGTAALRIGEAFGAGCSSGLMGGAFWGELERLELAYGTVNDLGVVTVETPLATWDL